MLPKSGRTIPSISDFPLEEQDLILQFGKIPRKFAHDPSDSRVQKFVNLFIQLTQAAAAYEVVGIDASVWQGYDIDFSILRQYVQFMFTRYVYGNDYRDPTAPVNVRGASDNGIIYDGYIYLTMKSWSKAATTFHAVRSDLGGQMYAAFDAEETGGLLKSELANWIYKCADLFCRLSVIDISNTLLYTSNGFYNSYVEPGILKVMELWIAHWTNLPNPSVPRDWLVKMWLFWQYAIGVMPGVDGKVDLDRCRLTKTQFETRFKVKLPPPLPPTIPAHVRVNTAELNVRNIPDDPADANTIMGKTYLGKVWKTTGIASQDAKGRGWWYQVADEHGQVLWLAGWLCVPA